MEQLTAKQLAEWEAYNNIDPIGEWRNDFKFSYMASIISNLMIQAYGKKGSKMTEIKDFLLQWDKEEESSKQQSVEEMKRVLLGLAASQNKKTEQSSQVKRRNI